MIRFCHCTLISIKTYHPQVRDTLFFTIPSVCADEYNRIWNPPCRWNGPEAAIYQSFDDSDGYVLMEGAVAAQIDFIKPGMVIPIANR